MPSTAHARSSDESTKPSRCRSTGCGGCRGRRSRRGARRRTGPRPVRRTNRAPVRNRDRSSMMPARNDGFPADVRAVHQVRGPDLVHRIGLEPAEGLRRLPAGPGGQLAGLQPPLDGPQRRRPAQPGRPGSGGPAPPVRAGFSIFSPAASSSVSVPSRGGHCRGEGTRASNPPSRRATTHRSIVRRDTADLPPVRPWCSRDARSRTTAPRCRDVRAGSIAGSVSAHRHSAMSLRRCRAAAACLSAAVTFGLLVMPGS